MSSHTPESKELSLDELVFGAALSQLQMLQYDQRSIRRYQTVWRKLVTFALQQGYKGKLREQLILDFVGKCDVNNFNQIRPEDLSDFVYSLSRYRRKTVAAVDGTARAREASQWV